MNRKLVFVGDICLAGRPSTAAVCRSSLAHALRAAVGNDACLVGTIEAPVAGGGRPKPYKACLRSEPKSLALLEGFDVGLLGNNHIEDFGAEAAIFTREALRGIGCKPVGYGLSLSEALAPAIVNLGEVKAAILSFCCLTTRADGFATDRSPGVAPLSLQLLIESIRRAREQVELVVICPHWGVQGAGLPTLDDLYLARACIDAGASAVIGTHAHVIQATELYKGAPIAYGLGNYLFDDVDVPYVDHEGKPSGHRLRVLQTEENRTSMVLALLPVQRGKGWGLEISGRWLAQQNQDMSITHRQLAGPTQVDLKFKKRLALSPIDFSERKEIGYACSVRDGVLVYNHFLPALDHVTFARALAVRAEQVLRGAWRRIQRR